MVEGVVSLAIVISAMLLFVLRAIGQFRQRRVAQAFMNVAFIEATTAVLVTMTPVRFLLAPHSFSFVPIDPKFGVTYVLQDSLSSLGEELLTLAFVTLAMAWAASESKNVQRMLKGTRPRTVRASQRNIR